MLAFFYKSALRLRPAKITKVSFRPVSTPFNRSFRRFSGTMATDSVNGDILCGFRKAVKEQGDLVRKLKETGAPVIDVDLAVRELKARKKILEAKEIELEAPAEKFDRGKLEDLLKRRFFYTPAFEIYGGVAGLYDFGPVGCAMETNIVSLWRSHFVLEEQFLEVRCTQLTPSQVLKSSGHVERFTDIMVKDSKTGECFRADHLLQGHIEKLMQVKNIDPEKKKEYQKILNQLDNYKKEQIWEELQKHDAKAPGTNNDLTEPVAFNLMFGTSIGPSGILPGFLRPETSQGIFLNFKRLLEYNNGKLPFGGAQIGCGFRNEISPRAGLLRVREFLMAEVEYFVDPECKDHAKFPSVADLKVRLLSTQNQMSGEAAAEITLQQALDKGIIKNTSVAYFLGRIHSFMLKVGVDTNRMRFRQHMANEMAHYACDCWDCELKTSYGWIECVGCADRACFDLSHHTIASGEKLVAQVDLAESVSVDVVEVIMDKQSVGKAFKKKAKSVTDKISTLSTAEIDELENAINQNGQHILNIGDEDVVIEKKMVKDIKRYKKDVHVREVEPHVIEPSFGIGRIMYSILEHNFKGREGDEQRNWLSLPPMVAPVKCSVLPLSKHPEFQPFVRQLSTALTELDMSCRVDDAGGSIGRRYARTDEIAIPFGITVDFDTVNKTPNTVTLRERNTTRQIRCEISVAPGLVNDLVRGRTKWDDVEKKFGLFEGQQTIDK